MPLVIAHRGASALAPENSLAALEAAIAHGADLVETDVRLSADGLPMCQHDPDLGRTHGIGTPVREMTAAALAGHGVLQLGQMIAAMAGRLPLLLDCKQDDEAYWDTVVAATAALPRDRVVYGVRTLASLHKVRARRADSAILGLLSGTADFPAFAAGGGNVARLWEEDVSAANLAMLRGLGLPVWVTTGGRDHTVGTTTPASLDAILARGVDGLLVNDPVMTRAAIDRMA